MFGYKKKISQLESKLMSVEMNYRTYVEVHEAEHRLYSENLQKQIDKQNQEIQNEMRTDISLIKFKVDNPNPYKLGEIKSGEYKGWIVISYEVREQTGLFTNEILGYTWETKIVNKKGEIKTI